MQSFRVEYTVTAFIKTENAVSPARIEKRIETYMPLVTLDPADEDAQVFGYVSNVKVTKND